MVVDDQRALLEGIITGVLVGKQISDRLRDIVVKLSLDGLAVFGHLIKQTRAKGWNVFLAGGLVGQSRRVKRTLRNGTSLKVFWVQRPAGFDKVCRGLFPHYHHISAGER